MKILYDKKNSSKIYGIDLSKNAVKKAKHKNQNFGFIIGDACFLPFKNNSFDLIICSELIEHIPTPKVLIEEINRITKKRGILILSTPNWLSLYGLFRFLGEKLLRRQLAAGNQPLDYWYTPKEIKKILRDHFEIDQMSGSWYFPPFGKGKKKIPNRLILFFIKKFSKIDYKMSDIFPNFGHIIIIKAIANKKH